jgi:hypothetical protein
MQVSAVLDPKAQQKSVVERNEKILKKARLKENRSVLVVMGSRSGSSRSRSR